MNREIKFRGWFQGINGQEYWVYGYLVKQTNGNWEITNGETSWTVDNVGQFTGLKDQAGNEIFEGDIIRYLYTDWPSKLNSDPRTLEQYLKDISKVGVVCFTNGKFKIEQTNSFGDKYYNSFFVGPHGRLNIIGNVYHDYELLMCGWKN